MSLAYYGNRIWELSWIIVRESLITYQNIMITYQKQGISNWALEKTQIKLITSETQNTPS